jgi:hypothetical protein
VGRRRPKSVLGTVEKMNIDSSHLMVKYRFSLIPQQHQLDHSHLAHKLAQDISISIDCTIGRLKLYDSLLMMLR